MVIWMRIDNSNEALEVREREYMRLEDRWDSSLFQDESIKVLFFLSHLFDELSIVKPITSRPTSSERYVLCSNFHPLSFSQRLKIQTSFWSYISSNLVASRKGENNIDCEENNPPQSLRDFQDYLIQRNNSLLIVQVIFLLFTLIVAVVREFFASLSSSLNRKRLCMDRRIIWREPTRKYHIPTYDRSNFRLF